jgi:phosphonate transport system permease protein
MPVPAMEATGASKLKVIAYAVVPQVMPAFSAIVILRWDINIRESTVLGLVGAGGIGVILQGSIDTFAWPTEATILIAIVVLVLIARGSRFRVTPAGTAAASSRWRRRRLRG